MQQKSIVRLWYATLQAIINHIRPLSIGICFFAAVLSIIAINAQAQLNVLFVQIIQNVVVGGATAIQSVDALFSLLLTQSQGKISLESLQAIAAVQAQLQLGFAAISPLLIAITLLLGCVQFVALQFYFIAVIKKQCSTLQTFWLLTQYILPIMLLTFWVLVRSFAWVPFIGPLLALVYIPRYSLASLLLIRHNTGIFTAAQKSFTLTRGHYWYIVRTTSVTVTIATAVLAVSMLIANVLPVNIAVKIASICLISQIYFAILMVFTEQLASQWKHFNN